MAASAARIGYGTALAWGTASGTYANALSEVYDSGFPNQNANDVEVTHYASPNTTEEFIAGLTQAGEIQFQMNYTATSYNSLLGIKGLLRYFQITLPDGYMIRFPGYVREIGGAIPVKDRITNSVTIKVAGAIAFTS